MNKYKTNHGRVAFVTLSFCIIATLMILSANNRAPELTYESPKEESNEVVLDDRAEAYIAEAIEAIDVIIEESEGVSGEPESFNEAFSMLLLFVLVLLPSPPKHSHRYFLLL